MDLALNNLQRLICHKTNKPSSNVHTSVFNLTQMCPRIHSIWLKYVQGSIQCGLNVYRNLFNLAQMYTQIYSTWLKCAHESIQSGSDVYFKSIQIGPAWFMQPVRKYRSAFRSFERAAFKWLFCVASIFERFLRSSTHKKCSFNGAYFTCVFVKSDCLLR